MSISEHKHVCEPDAEPARRVEIFTGAGRRRKRKRRLSPRASRMAFELAMWRAATAFLVASGLCRPGLDQTAPPVLQWRLSALPRYLPTADVERLIAHATYRTHSTCATGRHCCSLHGSAYVQAMSAAYALTTSTGVPAPCACAVRAGGAFACRYPRTSATRR